MKSSLLLSLSCAALLAPAVLWQVRVQDKTPLLPLPTAQQTTVTITRLPFRIDTPGRYVLGGSLAALPRPAKGLEAGIVIGVDHVELDLGGHLLVGAEGTTSGITIELPEKRSELIDVCVRNGTVTNWGGNGVDLALVQGARLLDLHASRNGGPRSSAAGLRVGAAALLQGCTALGNTGAGFVAGEGSLVGGCLSDRNGLEGFVLGGQSSARQSSATKNGRDGFLLNGGGGSLQDCSAAGNTGDGLNALLAASVRACNAANNGGSGIAVGRGSFVVDCTASGNRRAGVFANGGVTRIEGNHLVLNGTSYEVGGGGNVVGRNTVSDEWGGTSLLSASGPGGLFVSDAATLRISVAGVGSVLPKPGAGAPSFVEDGGLLAPWANIVVK